MPTRLTLNGTRYVILPEAEYLQLAEAADRPLMPEPDENGNYPAMAAVTCVLANKLREERMAAGLTQEEVAKEAGVRTETINRIEAGRQSPTVRTVDKIVDAVERLKRKKARSGKRTVGG